MRSALHSEQPEPFRHNRFLHVLLAIYAAIWIWAAVDPIYRFDWLLENLLVFAFFALMLGTYRRFPFSNLSYSFMFIFMVAHALGAHTTYAEQPVGFWMQDVFGFQRNHYDRVVHFGFGLLMTYPIREVLLRRAALQGAWLGGITLACVAFMSVLYEIVEFVVAQIVEPKAAYAYLGTQGDLFDAQKDSGLAMVGSLLTLLGIALVRWLRRRNDFMRKQETP